MKIVVKASDLAKEIDGYIEGQRIEKVLELSGNFSVHTYSSQGRVQVLASHFPEIEDSWLHLIGHCNHPYDSAGGLMSFIGPNPTDEPNNVEHLTVENLLELKEKIQKKRYSTNDLGVVVVSCPVKVVFIDGDGIVSFSPLA